jgi:RHS repeat-associated protein
MSKRSSDIRLRHMLDHAREAVAPAEGKTREDLDRDRLLELALVRLLEIVGEAASRVPEEERARYPQIPWAQMVGLRNRLVQGYDAVDLDILWQIVAVDLPHSLLPSRQSYRHQTPSEAHTGRDDRPYHPRSEAEWDGFTGERWDAYSQLLFLRARYHQPATGRFTSKDPWREATWQSQTPYVSSDAYQFAQDIRYRSIGTAHSLYPQAHDAYSYVLNNSVNWSDPTCLFPEQCDPDRDSRNLTSWLVREMHTQCNGWPTWAIDFLNDAGNALLSPAAGRLAEHALATILHGSGLSDRELDQVKQQQSQANVRLVMGSIIGQTI